MNHSTKRAIPLLQDLPRQRRLAEIMRPEPRLSGLRVALVNPWQTYPRWLGREFQSYFPMGVAMLGAVLEQMGVEVKLIDCLSYAHERTFTTSVVHGLPPEEVARQLAEFGPALIGITNPFSTFLDDAIDAARIAKGAVPGARIVLGGVAPSLDDGAELLQQNDVLDVLVAGEGEVTLCELVANFDRDRRELANLADIPGILFRAGNGVVETPERMFIDDLDELPYPAYHLIDLDRMYVNPNYARYRGRSPGTRHMPIHTSRGCPYSCSFCSVHSQVGKANRRHSPAYVRRHVQYLAETYGVSHFHFEDDNLTLNPARSRELFDALSPLKITWDTPNGVRADTITDDLARRMAASGARSVTIAVESGDQRVLDTIVNKRLDLDEVVAAARNLAAHDIPTLAFFIIGFPGETEIEVRRTLEFAKWLALEHHTANLLFVATPLPGTPLHRQCVEGGHFVRPLNNETLLSAIRLGQTPLIRTPEFDKAQLFRWARDVLDTPAIITVGDHIPFFFANSPQVFRRLDKAVNRTVNWGAARSFWRVPWNNPPRVVEECATDLTTPYPCAGGGSAARGRAPAG